MNKKAIRLGVACGIMLGATIVYNASVEPTARKN